MINHGFNPQRQLQQYHEYFSTHLRAARPDWDSVDRCCFVGEHQVLPLMHSVGLGDQQKDWLRSITNPVICACTNTLDVETLKIRLQQIMGHREFFVLHWDAACQVTESQAYWPFFFLEQRCRPRQDLQRRQYRISMLAGRVRPHRLRLWQAVRDLIQEDDVIVLNSFGRQHVVANDVNWQGLPLQDLPWSNHAAFLDSIDQIDQVIDTAATQHAAFRACVNITAESLGPGPGVFITEKTWKALASGCMLWHWGCDHAAGYLEDLGFRDWFDQPRAQGPALFARSDIKDFYHDNQHPVLQEVELFWSPELLRSLTEPTLVRLQSWLDR